MNSTPDPDDADLARALQGSRILEDAPEALIQRAIGLWQPRARPVPGITAGLLRRLVATCHFDSATIAPAAAGLRSAGPAATRQLLYTAEGHDIDLRLSPNPDGRHWQVSGQVLGPQVQGTAELLTGDRRAEQPWNELAEFHFDDVPDGRCTLTLRAADWELELPPLDLTR